MPEVVDIIMKAAAGLMSIEQFRGVAWHFTDCGCSAFTSDKYVMTSFVQLLHERLHRPNVVIVDEVTIPLEDGECSEYIGDELALWCHNKACEHGEWSDRDGMLCDSASKTHEQPFSSGRPAGSDAAGLIIVRSMEHDAALVFSRDDATS